VSGWRSGEALTLRWDEIDLARRTATLGDTKTGRSVRPLSHAACDVLRSLSRSGRLVFPATRGSGDLVMSGFKKLWKRIARLGGLPPAVPPHVLRHSFASLAADLGYSEWLGTKDVLLLQDICIRPMRSSSLRPTQSRTGQRS